MEGVVGDGGEGLVVVVPVVRDVGRARVGHAPQHQPTLEVLVLKCRQSHWKIAACRGSLNNKREQSYSDNMATGTLPFCPNDKQFFFVL